MQNQISRQTGFESEMIGSRGPGALESGYAVGDRRHALALIEKHDANRVSIPAAAARRLCTRERARERPDNKANCRGAQQQNKPVAQAIAGSALLQAGLLSRIGWLRAAAFGGEVASGSARR